MSLISHPGRGAACGDQAGRACGVGAAAASPAAPLTRVRSERGLRPLRCPCPAQRWWLLLGRVPGGARELSSEPLLRAHGCVSIRKRRVSILVSLTVLLSGSWQVPGCSRHYLPIYPSSR